VTAVHVEGTTRTDDLPAVPWPRALVGGGIAGVATVAPILTLGVLAASALGTHAAAIGIPAAFVSVALGGAIVGALGRAAVPAAGLSSATVLIFAGFFVRLANDPALGPREDACAMALVVALMGLVQILFGRLRFGSIAKFVPHPVLAGFMNAVAVLIVLAQLPLLFGVPLASWKGASPFASILPGALALGAFVAATIWIVTAKLPGKPAVLIGLAAGCVAAAILHVAFPALALGPTAGLVPTRVPTPAAWAPLFEHDGMALVFARHGRDLLVTGVLLAIIGSLETVLNAVATDHDVGHRHDPDRELMVFGLANLAVAAFGALPVVYWRSRALALRRMAGPGPRPAVVGAIATGLTFALLAEFIADLPMAILGGVMVMVGIALIDGWTRRLIRMALRGPRDPLLLINLGVVALVFVLTIREGFVVGVVAGVILALVLFIRAMNRSLVRARLSAAARPSRRVYPPAQEAALVQRRRGIELVVLEGALFFGNLERLATEVLATADHVRVVVLDLRRVTTLDASGAVALARLSEQLQRRDVRLLLAGVASGSAHHHEFLAADAARDFASTSFADADRALEAAEAHLLAELDGATVETIELSESVLAHDLEPGEIATLAGYLTRREYAAGEIVFRTGDAGTSLFVLARGSITILLFDADGAPGQRFVSFSTGMIFGETAMLDGAGRSASARADTDSLLLELTQVALDRLAAGHPALGVKVYRNVALHLSQRLRSASIAWREAD
jgi:MFS superfamily sulfate permease-like transporter